MEIFHPESRNRGKEYMRLRGRHTNSIPYFFASFLRISVSSRGTSGTTSPASKCTMAGFYTTHLDSQRK
jgi:hypothetical protein